MVRTPPSCGAYCCDDGDDDDEWMDGAAPTDGDMVKDF